MTRKSATRGRRRSTPECTLYLQADPCTGGHGRTPKAQMIDDLRDMRRRATGQHSPWGGWLLTRDGQPMAAVDGIPSEGQ